MLEHWSFFHLFLFVMYREGISYDPIILKFTNLIPGIRFKQTWLGTHFIPIMFYVVSLAVMTLLVSNDQISLSWLPGTEFSAVYIVVLVLAVIATMLYFFLDSIKYQKGQTTIAFCCFTGVCLVNDAGFVSQLHVPRIGTSSESKN